MVEMTSVIDPNKISVLSPSPEEIEEINRQIAVGALPQNYWALRKDATARAVFGQDAVKRRDGTYEEQGIGSAKNLTRNHFEAIKANEARKLELPGSYDRAVAKCWRENPVLAEKLGLPGKK